VPSPVVGCSASRNFKTASIERMAVTHYGRQVTPLGHLTDVGNFPGGGALTPDGRFYWAVDEGKDVNLVWIVSVADGSVVQSIYLPGSGGHAVFSPDGKTAYVSGNPTGNNAPPSGTPLMATGGNAIHVFAVDPATGKASEKAPIGIPSSANPVVGVGSSRQNHSVVASGGVAYSYTDWPEDLALSPDGKILLVALLNSDRAAIIDTATQAVTVVTVGAYPRGAAIERNGQFGYIANANDGTISKIDLTSKTVAATLTPTLASEDISVKESHVMALMADPRADQLYVPLANRDLLLVLDTKTDTFTNRIDLRRGGGKAGLGTSPVGLAESPDGCTLYVANAYENALTAVALKDRVDSATKAYSVIGRIPVADYPTAAAVTPDGNTLVWLSGKGMGTNKGANGNKPLRNKQFWQRGLVGVLERPDDRYFQQMDAVVSSNLTPDAQPVPAATVVHGVQNAPFNYAPSSQIQYVFLVVKENRTYDNIFGSMTRGDGAPKYELYEDNCGASNTAFEGASRTHPGCGITPNAHALTRRWPLFTQFMANSEQSEEGHIFSTSGWLTDYLQRNSHWEPSGRGRPYDTGLYPVAYPPKYFIFDQLAAAGLSYRNYGEKSGGVNPEPASQGANRSALQFAQVQANTNQEYPFNGLAACMTANATTDPAPLFAGCIYDSSARTMSRATGANVPPPGAVSRFQIFETEFTAMVNAGIWPRFTYLIQFNDHGQGNTKNNTTEAAQAADNDLALGQLVDLVSHSSIWSKSAIFVMEDDSQDGGDHVDSHRMPAYVISPWAKQGTSAANSPVITRRYDQLSMLRTIQLILGLPSPSLLHALSVPMYDAFIAPSDTPNTASYTAVLPERSLIEQNGKTPASTALAKNAPGLVALSQALPWDRTDAVPQALADRIHYANLWGDDHHYPGPGPNGSPLEAARAEAALAAFARADKTPSARARAVREALMPAGGEDD
jgi:YVTN family beta-propeller protein